MNRTLIAAALIAAITGPGLARDYLEDTLDAKPDRHTLGDLIRLQGAAEAEVNGRPR